MTSALENLFAMQLDSAGLTQYVREYQAIPGRKFRFDFAFVKSKRNFRPGIAWYSRT